MLPVYPVVIPLFTAALVAALTKVISKRASQVIAMVSTLATLAINLYLMNESAVQPIVYWFGNWRPRNSVALGISFAVDPAGAGLAAFASFLLLAAFVFSSSYFDGAGNHFHALMLGFLAAMCGFCLTGDMFNMFVFFELMSAAAFALCAYRTDDPGSLQGALNFGVTNTVAAYFVLTGIGILSARTGALNMAQMGQALGAGRLDSLVLTGFAFVVCGYLVKGAVFPFHFWLADAFAVAPSPVCVLFSGVMVEMGLYALARIYWSVFNRVLHPHLSGLVTLFVTIGIITAMAGAFMCYIQRNLKRLLAFSTVSHIGLMLIGIGLFTPAALAGVFIYVLGHGLVTGGLFLIAGLLLHRFRSIDESDLHAKARRERWAGAVFFAGGIALARVPFSGLAAGDDLMHAAANAAGFGWLHWMFLAAGAGTSAAVLRAGAHVFLGWGDAVDRGGAPKHEEKPETEPGDRHTPLTMLIPATVLVVCGLAIGLVPHLKSEASMVAMRFQNTLAYASHVLNAQPFPALPFPKTAPADRFDQLLTVLAAMTIVIVQLFSPRATRAFFATAAKPLGLLHRVHSGHIGDYIAFLTFGMACFGLLCVYCFR